MATTPDIRQISPMTMTGDRSPAAIAVRIKQLMALLGMNPATFARHIGWTPQLLNNYLQAKQRISLDEAFKLCAVTGVTLDWVYEGKRGALPLDLATRLPPEGNEKPSPAIAGR